MTTASAAKIGTPIKESAEVSAVDTAVGASFIASGIGSTVLGLMVVGAEMSTSFKDAINWVKPVGPLSGKTTIAVIAFLVSWALLHVGLKGRAVNLTTTFTIAMVLIVLGLLLTFPPVFILFAPAE
jgi:hypothetical protein